MDTTGWDPSLQRDWAKQQAQLSAQAVSRPTTQSLVLQRAVVKPRTDRLAYIAIRVAVAALMFWLGAMIP